MDYYLDDNNAVNRLVEEWRKYGKIIIGYDFDDTVFDFHQKGRTYKNVMNLLRECKKLGAYLIVFNFVIFIFSTTSKNNKICT